MQKAREIAEAEAKALEEEKAKVQANTEKEEKVLVTNPKDAIGQSIAALTKEAETSTTQQNKLLEDFKAIVNIKDKDLKDLKEENDLSDQGIAVAPRPFKSVTEENKKLQGIKTSLDNLITSQDDKLNELKTLYEQRFRTTELDEVTVYYRKKIERLTFQQKEAIALRNQLDIRLEKIKIATDFEKRRRIKRAAYDNESDRYTQGRTVLENIKRTTKPTEIPYTEDDFDFGDIQSDNIQILKNVNHVNNGFYLVIAVHKDENKRNEFLTKTVASGETNVDFFYDVSTSQYYIYTNTFNTIRDAIRAMDTKENKTYNKNMTLIKIEN